MDFLIFILFVGICCITGKLIEKNHYQNIRRREISLIKKPYISYGNKILDNKKIEKMDDELELKQQEKMRKYADNLEALYGEKPYEKRK